MKILVLNSGSSSQKSALFEIGLEPSADPVPPLWEGKLEWNGNVEKLTIKYSHDAEIRDQSRAADQKTSIERLLRNLWSGPTAVLKAPTEIGKRTWRGVNEE